MEFYAFYSVTQEKMLVEGGKLRERQRDRNSSSMITSCSIKCLFIHVFETRIYDRLWHTRYRAHPVHQPHPQRSPPITIYFCCERGPLSFFKLSRWEPDRLITQQHLIRTHSSTLNDKTVGKNMKY